MVDITDIVDSTLAAAQSPVARTGCLVVARAVRRAYVATDALARRRWSRTGTSVGSARIIDGLADRLTAFIIDQERAGTLEDIHDPDHVIRMPDIINQLLALPEAPRWRFRTSVQGPNVEVNLIDVLSGWLAGISLPELGERHLALISSPGWRVEQMVDAVTGHFQHYLAWTVGALVELVNIRLADAHIHQRLCPELGGYIRYGVRDPHALALMTSGIRSRRLAHAIVAELPIDGRLTREDLRSWLAELGLLKWRARFSAHQSEALDLLDFIRLPGRSLLKTLLESGNVKVDLPITIFDLSTPAGPLTLEPMRTEPKPAPLAAYAGDTHIVTVASQDQADLSAILDTGLDLTVEVDALSDPPALSVTLAFGDSWG